MRVGDIITLRLRRAEDSFALPRPWTTGRGGRPSPLPDAQHMHHRWDIYAVATVQEKGLRGDDRAYGVAPRAIVDEPSPAPRTCPSCRQWMRLGPGPGPNSPRHLRRLVETAQKHEIPSVRGHSGAAAPMLGYRSPEGCPYRLLTAALHAHTGRDPLRDVERCGRLMAFIADLDIAILDTSSPRCRRNENGHHLPADAHRGPRRIRR